MNTMNVGIGMLVVAATSILTGCGKEIGNTGGVTPYVRTYVAEGRARGVDVDTGGLFARFEEGAPQAATTGGIRVAYCRKRPDGQGKEIVFNREVWLRTSEEFHEIVVFHELGHCVSRMHRHNDNELAIMNTQLKITSDDWKANRAYYLDRHFR